MAHQFNGILWESALKRPDWYILIKDDFKHIEKLAEQESDYEKRKAIKADAYRLVEEAVAHRTLPLAESGPDLDVERQPIDTIVIHHTKSRPGMTLERLNAIQLLRIYGMYYADPTDPRERKFKGHPVWSGHYYNDQQVFWGYHWLVREDGTAKHILKDNYIGWHAGNWDINTRSVGICIDNDLSDSAPNDTVLEALAGVIRTNYPGIDSTRILGHCDINNQTVCPGHLFLESWKEQLIAKL